MFCDEKVIFESYNYNTIIICFYCFAHKYVLNRNNKSKELVFKSIKSQENLEIVYSYVLVNRWNFPQILEEFKGEIVS